MKLDCLAIVVCLIFFMALSSEVWAAYWDNGVPTRSCQWRPQAQPSCQKRYSFICIGSYGSVFEKIEACNNTPGPGSGDGLPENIRLRAGDVVGDFFRRDSYCRTFGAKDCNRSW